MVGRRRDGGKTLPSHSPRLPLPSHRFRRAAGTKDKRNEGSQVFRPRHLFSRVNRFLGRTTHSGEYLPRRSRVDRPGRCAGRLTSNPLPRYIGRKTLHVSCCQASRQPLAYARGKKNGLPRYFSNCDLHLLSSFKEAVLLLERACGLCPVMPPPSSLLDTPPASVPWGSPFSFDHPSCCARDVSRRRSILGCIVAFQVSNHTRGASVPLSVSKQCLQPPQPWWSGGEDSAVTENGSSASTLDAEPCTVTVHPHEDKHMQCCCSFARSPQHGKKTS